MQDHWENQMKIKGGNAVNACRIIEKSNEGKGWKCSKCMQEHWEIKSNEDNGMKWNNSKQVHWEIKSS